MSSHVDRDWQVRLQPDLDTGVGFHLVLATNAASSVTRDSDGRRGGRVDGDYRVEGRVAARKGEGVKVRNAVKWRWRD